MPRVACPEKPGVPLHLVQRGRGGAPCFLSAHDGTAFLVQLRECSTRLECAVHAYVLMRNHVHLLVTPAREGRAQRLMQSLRASARGWEEAYDGSPVYAPRYLLSCMRYIEENPVRAGLVDDPRYYRWSSFGANALGRDDPVVTPHAVYFALGRSPQVRRARYRAIFWHGRDAAPAPVQEKVKSRSRAGQTRAEYRVSPSGFGLRTLPSDG